MFPIVESELIAPDIKRFVIEAPRIARKRRAGQFVIVRVHEHGERIRSRSPTATPSGARSP